VAAAHSAAVALGDGRTPTGVLGACEEERACSAAGRWYNVRPVGMNGRVVSPEDKEPNSNSNSEAAATGKQQQQPGTSYARNPS